MINYLKGELAFMAENGVVVDVGGVGFYVNVSSATCTRLPRIGETVKIYTYMHVKEDGIALYGFVDAEEMDMFNMLITVSGIGPRAAVTMLSVMRPPDIILAIVTDDIVTLSRAPGVGKKTAQRLVLELKDKFKTADAIEIQDTQHTVQSTSAKQDALDALVSLGYSRGEAMKAVLEVALADMTTEQIIKLSLKKLSGS